nr:reducing polyketide synthase hmp8 [Quercus suber]
MTSDLNGSASASRPGAQAQDEASSQSKSPSFEPLAVVGMAFNLPQGTNSDEKLWRVLVDKRNTMSEWPADRVNVDAFYHPDPLRTNTVSQSRVQFDPIFELTKSRARQMSFRGGHFLDELPDAFDAPFFTLGAAEAAALDPAHRITLETTYQSLENGMTTTISSLSTLTPLTSRHHLGPDLGLAYICVRQLRLGRL